MNILGWLGHNELILFKLKRYSSSTDKTARGEAQTGFTLPMVKRFSPTSGIGKPAVNRRKPLETARNDNSNSKNR